MGPIYGYHIFIMFNVAIWLYILQLPFEFFNGRACNLEAEKRFHITSSTRFDAYIHVMAQTSPQQYEGIGDRDATDVV